MEIHPLTMTFGTKLPCKYVAICQKYARIISENIASSPGCISIPLWILRNDPWNIPAGSSIKMAGLLSLTLCSDGITSSDHSLMTRALWGHWPTHPYGRTSWSCLIRISKEKCIWTLSWSDNMFICSVSMVTRILRLRWEFHKCSIPWRLHCRNSTCFYTVQLHYFCFARFGTVKFGSPWLNK